MKDHRKNYNHIAGKCCGSCFFAVIGSRYLLCQLNKSKSRSISGDRVALIGLCDEYMRANELELTPISSLDLDTGTKNALYRAGYRSVASVHGKSIRDLMSIKKIGIISAQSIIDAVESCLSQLEKETDDEQDTTDLFND